MRDPRCTTVSEVSNSEKEGTCLEVLKLQSRGQGSCKRKPLPSTSPGGRNLLFHSGREGTGPVGTTRTFLPKYGEILTGLVGPPLREEDCGVDKSVTVFHVGSKVVETCGSRSRRPREDLEDLHLREARVYYICVSLRYQDVGPSRQVSDTLEPLRRSAEDILPLPWWWVVGSLGSPQYRGTHPEGSFHELGVSPSKSDTSIFLVLLSPPSLT